MKTILIVDGDERVAQSLSELVQGRYEGMYTIVTASDFDSANGLIASEEIVFAIVSGTVERSTAKANNICKSLGAMGANYIRTTGFAASDILDYRGQGVLEKPIRVEVFFQKLSECLPER